MEGDSYITFNPDLFQDSNQWSYRDLQRLCKRLTLPANGSRDVLVERLHCWHRTKFTEPKAIGDRTMGTFESDMQSSMDEENLEINTMANNFAMLSVQVKSTPMSVRRRKTSLLTESSKAINAEAGQLRPLRQILEPVIPETPSRGILKKQRVVEPEEGIVRGSSTRPSRIAFSPFNAVKVIPHRLSHVTVNLMEQFSDHSFDDDTDEEPDDEDIHSAEEEYYDVDDLDVMDYVDGDAHHEQVDHYGDEDDFEERSSPNNSTLENSFPEHCRSSDSEDDNDDGCALSPVVPTSQVASYSVRNERERES